MKVIKINLFDVVAKYLILFDASIDVCGGWIELPKRTIVADSKITGRRAYIAPSLSFGK